MAGRQVSGISLIINVVLALLADVFSHMHTPKDKAMLDTATDASLGPQDIRGPTHIPLEDDKPTKVGDGRCYTIGPSCERQRLIIAPQADLKTLQGESTSRQRLVRQLNHVRCSLLRVYEYVAETIVYCLGCIANG